DGIRDKLVTGVQTCALPICCGKALQPGARFCPSCGSDTSGDQTAVSSKKVDSVPTQLSKGDAGLIEALRQATLGEYEIMGLLGRSEERRVGKEWRARGERSE